MLNRLVSLISLQEGFMAADNTSGSVFISPTPFSVSATLSNEFDFIYFASIILPEELQDYYIQIIHLSTQNETVASIP